MSDSLTEIMKGMRNAPTPSAEYLAWCRDRDGRKKAGEEAMVRAAEIFVCATLYDGKTTGMSELDFWFHDVLGKAIRNLERKGVIQHTESFYQWKLVGELQQPEVDEYRKLRRRKPV